MKTTQNQPVKPVLKLAPETVTKDENAGMEWWNSLTPVVRSYWLSVAGSAVPADAWEAFKSPSRGFYEV